MDLFVAPRLHRPLRSAVDPHALRDAFASQIAEAACTLLDPDRIEAIGEDMGVVVQHRVHHAGLLVCAMVLAALGRGSDTEGRWLDTQVIYRRLGGPDSGTTSIRKMGRRLRPVLHALMQRRMDQILAETRDVELRGRLQSFRDVLIPDGCAFKLASLLSGLFPGTGQPAEMKLHAIYSVKAGTATHVTPTAGSVHDSDGFWPASWERGALYIWDLGFNSYARFVDAALAGAHVLQRLKEKANPIVLRSYGPSGIAREVLDNHAGRMGLNEACEFGHVHKQSTLDLDVVIEAEDGREVVARVVCVRLGGEDFYYLTTLPRDVFTPHDVAEIYRVRWEAELFFKGWKGGARLDHIHRLKNPDSLAVSVAASMLAALLARDLHARLERLADTDTPATANDVARDAVSP
jgi:putative transposase